MSEEKFDVIIVGGGLAGLTAAYVLANDGYEVMVVERGDYCGAKNMTGGRLYGHSLERIIPGFADEAPVERKVVKETISLQSKNGAVNISYQSPDLGETATASYTVLRGKFDQWLAQKAEEAGAMIATGFRVDDVVLDENGKAIGIDAAGEIMNADVVILADGVNSLLAQKLGMKKEILPNQVAVGAKEVIKLSEKTINERFGLKDGEGAAMMVAGDPTDGNLGGGFIYTNKDSVSIGIVATLSDIGRSQVPVTEMVERFKEHPAVAPLIEGGEMIEYSGHLVTEEGFHMIPELYRDGILVVGDAAAFVINQGYTVRGMDFAIESGKLAAEAVKAAKAAGKFDAETLSVYERLLEDSFVFGDMKKAAGFPELLSEHAIFNDVPAIAEDVFKSLFVVDGGAPKSIAMTAVDSVCRHTSAQELIGFLGKAMEVL
ncbi:MAG: FAD-dependent oxidoreductase [Clostridia bacterium]|nr:FAD-dependent oxidoreductase [Clostridia bacterium]